MKLLNHFAKKAPNKVTLAIVMGALAGVCYSALIPLVLESIASPNPAFDEIDNTAKTFLTFEVSNYRLAGLYFFACILVLLTRSLSEIILLNVGSDVGKAIRVDFYNRISKAPILTLEKLGSAKLMAAINIDVPRIIMGARVLPGIFINVITLVGMLSFLMYLNREVFDLVIVSIIVGIMVYQLPIMIGRRIFNSNREINDDLQESIRGLIHGAKELKLDKQKRINYFERILLNYEGELVRTEKAGQTILRATVSLGDLLSFFVIGTICFIFINYHAVGQRELVGVVMALLYITTPIAVVLNSLPQLTVATVSSRKLERLLSEMPSEEINSDARKVTDWEEMVFKGVCYHYPSDKEEKGFIVGPIDLVIRRGEISFIVGSNGSGKSTLSKLITLHYLPSDGDIRFGSEVITSESISGCRQNICAIYSDYYLFDRMLIDLDEKTTAIAHGYLKDLQLDKKVTIKNGLFSTTQLSDGQRKRLALLVAFLEDKELYLFDEWAADQDPAFKNVFYTKILPELKDRGKAVVVISHDDRYFNIADRIIVMEQGRIALSDSAIPVAIPEPAAMA